MACTPQEAATYTMLQQVLRNHIGTSALCWESVATMVTCELGDLGLQLYKARVDVRTYGDTCARVLKR